MEILRNYTILTLSNLFLVNHKIKLQQEKAKETQNQRIKQTQEIQDQR
jgi:hypothetical protein